MEVRNYSEKDRDAVRRICHETATAPKYIKSPKLVCALYADYYIDCEPQNCFVLTDEFDKAVGYILCAEKRTTFEEKIAPYLKEAGKISISSRIGFAIEAQATRKLAKEYPAHLHIDILPAFQSKGGGRMLMEKLLGTLRDKGVAGIMLSVGADNRNAQAFYEHLEFEKVKSLFGAAIVYAKKLD